MVVELAADPNGRFAAAHAFPLAATPLAQTWWSLLRLGLRTGGQRIGMPPSMLAPSSPGTISTGTVSGATSTLTLAVIRGLLQDANAIGDQKRVSAAFERYAALLHAAHTPH
jgi:hypothetical protein